MRYIVEHKPNGSFVMDTANPCRDYLAMHVELAEAAVIVFALNAVSRGDELCYFTPDTPTQRGMAVPYEGPTEGVAP